MHRPGIVHIRVCAILAVLLGSGLARGQDIVISELMASNPGVLIDRYGDSPDWFEIVNVGTTLVNLEGWTVSDNDEDTGKWVFPALDLAPGEFLVVFASGRDQRNPLEELHTNFQLDEEGEFLGLFDPSGNPISFYNPEFPPQVPHASYGLVMETSTRNLLAQGATARFLVPEDNDLQETWFLPDFEDAAWATGPTGLGFETREAPETPIFEDLIATDVGPLMEGIGSSIYVRIPFEVPAGDVPANLLLRVKYDDGFAAFLNGVEVARRNVDSRPEFPATLRYSSRAIRDRDDQEALTFEDIPVLAGGLLQPGTNLLAIQAMSRSRVSDEDFLMVPELDALELEVVETNTRRYFAVPTPVWPNGEPSGGVAATPTFTLPDMSFVDPITVEISTAHPEAQIHYTLDGRDPTEESPLYTEPLLLESTATIKARSFREGYVPSATQTRTYLGIAANLESFSSNIPVVVCSTVERPIGNYCGGGLYTPGQMVIFTPGTDGRARLSNLPHVADIAAFRKRGSSTCGRPKFSFNVEFKESFDPETTADLRAPDPLGVAKNVSVFGLPADSDWIMYGPYNFDRALMRNALAYWMSREVGRWAARTRFVECYFVNNSATRVSPVSTTHYMGVYVFMEKNKRHPERVPVEGLSSLISEPPLVEGGYILRRDRVSSGEVATSAGGYGNLVFVYPKLPTTSQRAYITSYLNQAIGSLNPNIGSQEDSSLIDVDEFLDHHILNWYPKNVDAFRLSGYFHKKRNGLLAMGPVWDYDRTMGCAEDSRAASPTGWDNNSSGDGGTRYFQSGGLGSWYSLLFQNQPPTGDSPWARAYRARWRELRSGPLRTDNILGQIDEWAAELNEAAVRNFNKWRGVAPRGGSLQGEVNILKNWLSQRADWIDAQFIAQPIFDPEPVEGLVPDGLEVAISVEEGQIYYTLNGGDPMATSGLPAPEAIEYTGALTVTENARIRARARVGERTWSQMIEGLYVVRLLPLVITEVMYTSPAFPDDQFDDRDYDFLEIHNIGEEPVSLAGIHSERTGLQFDLTGSDPGVLEPGGYTVVVDNLEAFRSRYGDEVPVAAEFTRGSLSDRRETVQLLGPIGETLLEFRYEQEWYPSTDGNEPDTAGEGRSLVIRDPTAPRETWNEAASWRPSSQVGGSPGRADKAGGLQRPGDFTQDQHLSVSDAANILLYLHGQSQGPCETQEGNATVLDVNGDGQLDITDAIFTLRYIFRRGLPPTLGVDCIVVPGCPDACLGAR